MPLVHIDILEGWPPEELRALGEAVQRALVDTLDVPPRDHFQVVNEHRPDRLVFNRSYLDIDRSDRFVLIHVTLAAGRTTEAKQAFYSRLCAYLAEDIGLRAEDLAVALVENQREDWSFGRGEASYLALPKEQWP